MATGPHHPPHRPISDAKRSVPVVDSGTSFRGRVWDVQTDRVELRDGDVVTRDFVRHPGAVAVIPYSPSGEVLLLCQYRHPVGRELWEPPAGLLDIPGEDPLAAAKRELYEEADLRAEEWSVLVDFFTSPGGSSESIRVYLAEKTSDVPAAERFEREAEERDMWSRWVPLDDAVQAVAEGRIASPTAVVGLLALDYALRHDRKPLRYVDEARG